MASNNEAKRTLYSWRPFFREVAGKLCELWKQADGDWEITECTKEIFGEEHEIVDRYYLKLSGGIDPFSFIYTLSRCASKHNKDGTASKNYKPIENAHRVLGLEYSLEDFNDYEFPHANNQNSYFHLRGWYAEKDASKKERRTKREELWKLFDQMYNAKEYRDIADPTIRDLLHRRNIGLANLTHVMFLINPDVFLPLDDRTLPLLSCADANISADGQNKMSALIKSDDESFSNIMEIAHDAFVGCQPYHINYFAYLLQQDKLSLTDEVWQISSKRSGPDNGTYHEEFIENNLVQTGGPNDMSGTPFKYLGVPQRGDCILLKQGQLTKYAIGIVLENGYINAAGDVEHTKEAGIEVVWIGIETKRVGGFDMRAFVRFHKNLADAWPTTAKIIKNIKNKQRGRVEMIKEMLEKYKEYTNLLEANRNLVLTGAPGTGKTHLAKQIARCLLRLPAAAKPEEGEHEPTASKHKLENDDRFGFVQFHPSYDYTDFIEGLRPFSKGEGEIGFELRAGIFKEFCERARERADQNFVFVIDEINRGEVAKIFGELFFSIDPGYRGERGALKTQYHNLHRKRDDQQADDPEEDTSLFYVPENVYIIGTMNNIDRSVESFDFAIRRRFAWREIEYSETMGDILAELPGNLRQEAQDRLKRLNDAIGKIAELSTDYHIGAAYLLKIREYNDAERWNSLWKYHLAPLLGEYVRTLPEKDKKLDELKKAYDGN